MHIVGQVLAPYELHSTFAFGHELNPGNVQIFAAGAGSVDDAGTEGAAEDAGTFTTLTADAVPPAAVVTCAAVVTLTPFVLFAPFMPFIAAFAAYVSPPY